MGPRPGAAYVPRPFPHALEVGRFLHDESVRRGNAGWSDALKHPTILRGRLMPRMMSDFGESPLEPMMRMHEAAQQESVIHVCILRVDFLKNSAGAATTGNGRFDLRRNVTPKIAVDPPPHDKKYFEKHVEALRRYYDVQTNQGLRIEADIFPQEPDSAFHLSDTALYGPWIFSVSDDSILARAERMSRNSVHLADSLDPTIQWNKYQSFIVFHAGTDFQGDVNQDTPYDIPSFNLSLGESLEVKVGIGRPDSAKVNLVMIVPETVSQDDFLGALNGVLAHEFGHQLGFFDLYDTHFGLPVVGVFSLMDSGNDTFGEIPDPNDTTSYVAVRGILPASIDPWHRLLFPFFRVNVHPAVDGATDSLRAVLLGNDLLYIPIHLGEYFIAENRPIDYNGDGAVVLRQDRADSTFVVLGPEAPEDAPADSSLAKREYDYLLPGGGTLVWHIDENAAIDGLYSPFGSVNTFSDRRGVAIEEADGIKDIGSASAEFTGGPFDPYFVGGYTKFGPNTIPNSDSNDHTATGVALEVLDPPGLTMGVRVGTPEVVPGWPVLFHGRPALDGINKADMDGDGDAESILFAADSTLIAVTGEDGSPLWGYTFPDTLTTAPSVVGDWPPSDPGPTVLMRAGKRAYWLPIRLGSWLASPESLRVSAGPIVADGEIAIGCADGFARGIIQNANHTVSVAPWKFPPSLEEPDSMTALAVGSDGPQAIRIAAGMKSGLVFAGGADHAVLSGWPCPAAPGPIRSVLLLRAPLRLDDPARDLVLIGSDRKIDLRGVDGRSIGAWPVTIPDTLAGEPAVGDLDGDGVLEVAATTRGGDLLLWELNGTSEPHWPRSAWEPDRQYRPFCVAGPRFWKIGPEGKVYLIQLRGDGVQLAIDADGRTIDPLPHASARYGAGGPVRLKGALGTERWYFLNAVADSGAVSVVDLRDLAVDDASVGTFGGPGGGPSRNGVYPSALVPQPDAVAGLADPAAVILHPNPVRDGNLKIRYVLGERATIDAEALDVSGHACAHAQWQGFPGAAGETHVWNLGDLASGLYAVRLEIRGEQHTSTITRMVAVVR